MTAPRYDIYRLIHKGMRSFLTEALLTLGRLDPQSAADLHAGMTQLRSLLDFCDSHLEHENTFIHKAMNARQPGSATDMDHHHDMHKQMIMELRGMADQLLASGDGEREAICALLYRKLAVFVADNLAHMHEEETVNNAILWRYYSDDEIRAIEHALVETIPPQKHAEAMQWVLPALNHQERHAFLSGVRRAAPAPVFEGLLSIARERLSGSEWNKLQFALSC